MGLDKSLGIDLSPTINTSEFRFGAVVEGPFQLSHQNDET